MPDENVLHRAGRSDALLNAQLAFALNGYSFDGLAERHIQTLNREAIMRRASTPLQRYCLLNNCEPWECIAAVLNRFRRREDGARLWPTYRMAREVFNGTVHPADKTRDEIFQSVQRRLFLPKPVHAEVIQYLRVMGLTGVNPHD
ncbi:TPA: hypothetical protein JG883_004488 [Enterobacter hormaechei subsp. xiangfangensis]|uniref:hypothetical protein n=1 Tax=Enterobacter hormaechei TaxID=158836 RepID=UPI00079B152A|nr:hypothetical protein [Enterobacter hormaechei]SAD25686.1 Uncharacterised protein [Enterobacter hormaechei]HAV1665637.1 hypothetical protein [Enterobacter hormaechei subsp. xiangfangensis]HAV1667047.1 hypothetical protein [Enterobacter hormaechei subsp. xiangfangensis]HCM9587087.1 hypothetical protein [Enterobacter hormaechei subsp. steigerwaltii]